MRFGAREHTLIALVVFVTLYGAFVAHADTVSELQAKIASRNSDILNLEKEIAAFQSQLDTLGKQKQSLQNAISTLDTARKKLSTNISVTQARIETTDLHIEQLALEIDDKATRIDKTDESVAEALREVSRLDRQAPVANILNGSSLTELWNEFAALQLLQENLHTHLDVLTTLKKDFEAKKGQSEKEKANLVALKKDLASQKQALDANRADKSKLLTDTKNQESNYQKLLSQKVALRKQFEQEVNDFESQLKIAIDPSSLPKTGSGVLSWPVDNVVITQYFGNTDFATQNPQIYNGHGHNGIDLRASPGTPIKAALSGTVMGIGDTDLTCPNASYGRWVLVRHNNGLTTLYAHLSLIAVSQGQSVATGQVVGYSGSTGYATGPHLHFTVYATEGVQIAKLPSRATACAGRIYTLPVADLKAYLNPLSYL